MATFVFTDGFVSINSVTLSTRVKSVTLNYEADSVENTGMGVGSRSFLAGLKTWSIDVEFNQDFAAANVDATMFPLVGAAEFPIELRPTTAVASAANPKFTGNCILEKYGPLAGGVGDLAMVTATLKGSGILTRATV